MAPPEIVAVIPARGGSTRIPHKNLAPLAGEPLVAHTVRAGRRARLVDRVCVSTDDADIARVSRRHGAEVITRPPELATATAQTEPALQHAVRSVEAGGARVRAVVMLQPTSPLRGSRAIDQGIRVMLETGCDSVVGVARDVSYFFLADLDAAGRLVPGFDPLRRPRTQEIRPRYRETGALYVMSRAQLMEGGCRMGGHIRPLVMEALESVDIDEAADLQLCEALIACGEDPLQGAEKIVS